MGETEDARVQPSASQPTLMLLYMAARRVEGTSAPPLTPRFNLMNASRVILCFTAGLCRSVFNMIRAKDRT